MYATLVVPKKSCVATADTPQSLSQKICTYGTSGEYGLVLVNTWGRRWAHLTYLRLYEGQCCVRKEHLHLEVEVAEDNN